MKILQVTRQFYPALGGIESVVLNLGRELCAHGHQVGVVTLNRLWNERQVLPPFEIISGIQVHRIPHYGSRRYAFSPAVLNFLPSYDLVAIHSTDFFLDYLAFTHWIHRKPLVLHTHGMYFHTPYARRLKQIYFLTGTSLAFNHLSAILCDSMQDFRLLGRIAVPSKLHLVQNGVDPSLFSLPSPNREPDLLLSVGRLAENKRFDRLLDAFYIVMEQRPQARLVMIGRDEGESKRLNEQVRSLGLTDNVHFLGEVSQKVLMDYLVRATLWLSSSEYESFGVGLLEGMAAGCIPVISNIPAYRELIENGENGFVVDFTAPQQTAKVILKALELPSSEISRMAENARTKAGCYSWNVIAGQFEAIYQHVLERE